MASLLGSLITILESSTTDQPTATKTVTQQTTSTESKTTHTKPVSQNETSQTDPTSRMPQTNAFYAAGSIQPYSANGTAITTFSSTSFPSVSAGTTLTDTSPAQSKNTPTSTSISTLDLTSSASTATTSSDISTATSSSSVTSPSPTTFTTSTSVTSSSSSTITAASTSSPVAQPTSAADSSSTSGGKVSTVGIAVAAVLGFLVLATMLFLIFRYCAPIRRRYDTWQEKKRLARTYREAIDGVPSPTDKIARNGSPQLDTYTSNRFYGNDNVDHRYNTPGGNGLGLGNRLSLLMQHAPFQSSHQGVDRSQIGIAMTDPRARGQYYPAR